MLGELHLCVPNSELPSQVPATALATGQAAAELWGDNSAKAVNKFVVAGEHGADAGDLGECREVREGDSDY
mgnify:CR=1 FL=1